MPESSKITELLKEALTPITSLLLDDSTDDEVYVRGCEALTVTCQLYPHFPFKKLKFVRNALMEILEYDDLDIVPHGCFGIAYLCHGRKKMVVQKKNFEHFVDRLMELISCFDSEMHVKSMAAVTALGAIVRWGSCSDIEVIIKKDALKMIMCWLNERDRWFVKNGCWIVSNIIARKGNDMKAVLGPSLIKSLVSVVEQWKLLDVKKEAAWAISNAVFGAEPSQIKVLKHLVKPLWSLIQSFDKDREIVSICLRALVRLEGMEVTCNGRLIDPAKIKEYLVRLQGAALLSEDVLWLAKLKKLRHADDTTQEQRTKHTYYGYLHQRKSNNENLCNWPLGR